MRWLEMDAAVREAQGILERADTFTQRMANMIRGKLKSGGVSGYTLAILKKELQDFDMRTKEWKD